MDFFVKKESKDDHLDRDAVPGDLDLIISPRDGMLVVVAMMGGVHVCGRCLEQFILENPSSPLRGVEWNPGGYGTRMMLHAGCVQTVKSYPGNLLEDRVRGHQLRRFATKATSTTRKKDSAP